jgi:hypothetical protein
VSKKALKPKQDNLVQLDKGSKIEQNSSGNCSPNIVGANSTVNCPVSASSIVENAGKMTGIEIIGAQTPHGGDTVVKGLPGSQTDEIKIKMENPSNPSPDPASIPPTSGKAGIGLFGHDSGITVADSVVCGFPSGAHGAGEVNQTHFNQFSVNDPDKCNWPMLLAGIGSRQYPLRVFMQAWRNRMEKAWEDNRVTESELKIYRAEIESLTQEIVTTDDKQLDDLLSKLQSTPPKFKVYLPN